MAVPPHWYRANADDCMGGLHKNTHARAERQALMRKIAQWPSVHRLAAALSIVAVFQATETRASDKLLDDAVQFTGTALFLETKVPGLVIGGFRNGETAVAGFGKTAAESD